MHYVISGLCPSGNEPGNYGFSIYLAPQFRELVSQSEINQAKVESALGNLGRLWLDRCGYSRLFDPDNCGFEMDPKRPPGPRAEPMWKPNRQLRVQWGEWGPEHITVPGNACGLDISRSSCSIFRGGASLHPHNVDCWSQVQLLLIVFTWFAEAMVSESIAKPLRQLNANGGAM